LPFGLHGQGWDIDGFGLRKLKAASHFLIHCVIPGIGNFQIGIKKRMTISAI
jgi:hypothetical protein